MYLLDTNVVSELRRPRPHKAVLNWIKAVPADRLFLSAVTAGEIQAGIERTREQDTAKAAELESWLGRVIDSYGILPMDVAAFREWARLKHRQSDSLFEDAMDRRHGSKPFERTSRRALLRISGYCSNGSPSSSWAASTKPAVPAGEAAQVIEELIQLARELREANARGEKLRLSEDELAFYDALETNDSAVQVAGRRNPSSDRARTGGDCAWQRHHRLDATRECARQSPPTGQAYPPQVRLPAGQTGEGDSDGARTGRGVVRRLGGVSSYFGETAPINTTSCVRYSSPDRKRGTLV